ncbi:hypothetical protein BEWA_022380 [Theileria equi strain WA]|uniref:Signal peptide-containing protein n=1 Tax=Theileria equi strain WA TaxID=1537102 RepID=L0AV35_THEEQ|nr:hypothetical protein BEWA_022380 [Theileria equi strain WA]AFZ79390.1 hypothetical protein BEWA_022380 [Theileria equi strain WA]|eukprot:XP_004829056.1 hypothetical protein BEWA_022380 [Theileria equi strain WA]
MKFLFALFSVATHLAHCSLVLNLGQDVGSYGGGDGEVILVDVKRVAGKGDKDEYLLLKHSFPSPFDLKGARIGTSAQFGIHSEEKVSEAQVYFKKRVPVLLKLVTARNGPFLFENLGRNSWRSYLKTAGSTDADLPTEDMDRIYSNIQSALTLDICKRGGEYNGDIAGATKISVGEKQVVGNYVMFTHKVPEGKQLHLFSCRDVHQSGISAGNEREVSVFFREDVPIVVRFKSQTNERYYRLIGQDLWEPVHASTYIRRLTLGTEQGEEEDDEEEDVDLKKGDRVTVDFGTLKVRKSVPFEPKVEVEPPITVTLGTRSSAQATEKREGEAQQGSVEARRDGEGQAQREESEAAPSPLQESALFRLLDDAFAGVSKLVIIDIGRRTGNQGYDQYLTYTYVPSVTAHAIILRKAETNEHAIYSHQLTANSWFRVFRFIHNGQVLDIKYTGPVKSVRVHWSKVSNDPVFIELVAPSSEPGAFFYSDGRWKSARSKEESLKLALEAAKKRPARKTEQQEDLLDQEIVELLKDSVKPLRGAQPEQNNKSVEKSGKNAEKSKKKSGFKTSGTGLLMILLLYSYLG